MSSPSTHRIVPKAKGCFSRIKRVLAAAVIALLGLILCGVIYQEAAAGNDRALYPPPGEMVDVGGYSLHLYCVGTGSPTVLLEAGLGDNWLTWSLVQEEAGEFTRVCAYDRAGLGWSDSAPAPMQTAQVAETLHVLLNNAGIAGPFVLVGHSLGGIHVRTYARLYPDEVAGIILVDSSHENMMVRFPPEIIESEKKKLSTFIGTLSLCRALAPFGLVRLFGLTASSAEDKPLSPEQKQMLVATLNRTNYCQAVKDEMVTAIEIEGSRDRPPYDLGDLPLIVLTSPIDPKSRSPEDLPAGVTVEMAGQADRLFMEMQQELAGLSSRGEFILAEGCTHYIQFDRPGLVIDAVRRIWESVQTQ